MFGRRFSKVILFFGVIVLLACAFALVIRPWYLRWGATDAEMQMALPGDQLLPDSASQATRAITTCLIFQHRDPVTHDRVSPVINAIFEPISFVIERGMLRGIRQRAELTTPAGTAPVR